MWHEGGGIVGTPEWLVYIQDVSLTKWAEKANDDFKQVTTEKQPFRELICQWLS